MSEVKIISGGSLPNMPWQEPDKDCNTPVWRYNENPIINRNPVENVARIFNSAVVPYEDAYIGVFREVNRTTEFRIFILAEVKMVFIGTSTRIRYPLWMENGNDFAPRYAYDPRLVEVEGVYYIIWCTDFYGAAIGMAKTTDFKVYPH